MLIQDTKKREVRKDIKKSAMKKGRKKTKKQMKPTCGALGRAVHARTPFNQDDLVISKMTKNDGNTVT